MTEVEDVTGTPRCLHEHATGSFDHQRAGTQQQRGVEVALDTAIEAHAAPAFA